MFAQGATVREKCITCDEMPRTVIRLAKRFQGGGRSIHTISPQLSPDKVLDCTLLFRLAEEKHDLFLYRNQILTFSLLNRCSIRVLKVSLVSNQSPRYL